jgi:AraC-like DNA-binding protein
MSVERPKERIESGLLPYHAHPSAYLAVVLAGSYEELGESGRFQVEPGDVIYHPAFGPHSDRIGRSGAIVLNLEVTRIDEPRGWCGRLADPGRIIELANEHPAAALEQIWMSSERRSSQVADWPDVLANDLAAGEDDDLRGWAERHGLRSESVSRGFRRAYGVPPRRFRADARARRAWVEILGSRTPLAAIAFAEGFADQSHMTREVRRLTGAPPAIWRRSSAG